MKSLSRKHRSGSLFSVSRVWDCADNAWALGDSLSQKTRGAVNEDFPYQHPELPQLR